MGLEISKGYSSHLNSVKLNAYYGEIHANIILGNRPREKMLWQYVKFLTWKDP